MTTQTWKSRAETMLTQFINRDGIGIENFGGDHNSFSNEHDDPLSTSSSSKLFPVSYSRLENFSTSDDPQSTCTNYYDFLSVKERLHCGCFSGGVDGNGAGAGTCISLLSTWAKVVFGKVIRAYTSSPLLLALVPLVFGLGIGYWVGNRSSINEHAITSAEKRKGYNNIQIFWGYVLDIQRKSLRWLSLHILMAFAVISPSQKLANCGRSNDSELFQDERDEKARADLRNADKEQESGVDLQCVPKHIAVIMDGNRRYGKAKYGNATRGHWDGSKTLIDFSKWCMSEGVKVLTVYAFSTENWDRDPAEVSALMTIFCKYCEEIRVEAIERGIRVHVLTTKHEKIPKEVKLGIDRMVSQTQHCDKFTMNICLSYGGRGEITNACKQIALDVKEGKLAADEVDENELKQRMLTQHCCDPDIIIRTSGEERISNFLLWQAAYSEFFFLKKQWPELQKQDLIEVIRSYAKGRKRRFGK